MTDPQEFAGPSLVVMTAEIVANYVAGNRVSVGELNGLIRSVHLALDGVAKGQASEAQAPEVTRATAGKIRKSITEAGLISFEDGKIYQTLKRHLTGRGLTLAQYREKWGLPSDYPATAPGYAARRSELAKAIGLGRKRAPTPAAPPKKSPPKKS